MGLFSWMLGTNKPKTPKNAKKQRRYEAVKTTNMVWDRVRAFDSGANTELGQSLERLRDRSWYEFRNSPKARAGVESLVNLVVSTGIDVQPATGDEEDDAELHEMFLMWAEHAGADGNTTLWELQRQAFRSVVCSGEALWQIVTIPQRDDPRRPVPVAINPLDPKQLSLDPVAPVEKGLEFIQGVEVDAFGRPVWYHITASSDKGFQTGVTDKQIGVAGSADFAMPQNLQDGQFEFNTGASGKKGVKVPAREIIHIYEKLRPGQIRGEPKLAPVLDALQQDRDMITYEMASAKIAAAFAVFITSDAEGDLSGLSEAEEDEEVSGSNEDGQGNPFYRVEGGAVNQLQPGEKVEQVNSNRPSDKMAPFRDMIDGDIAASLSIRRTDLNRDYSGANYSSMRAAQLDVRRGLDPTQNWFGDSVSCEVWRRTLMLFATAANVTPPTIDAELREFMRCKAMPVGHPFVDPDKDGKAAIQNIRGSLSTWQEEVGKRGKDARRVKQQLETELEDEMYQAVWNDGRDLTKAEVPDSTSETSETAEDRSGGLFFDSETGRTLEINGDSVKWMKF